MAEEEKQEEQKSGSKGLMIALIVVILLLVIGIGVMTFMLLSGGDKNDGSANGGGQVNAEAQIDDGIPRDFSPKYKQYEPPEAGAPPQYFAMEPFVVNFKGEGEAKYLAVTLKFMSHYPQLIQDMENYRPILRNDVTALLRVQTYSEMNLDNGPDLLRKRILEKARAVLEKNGIYPDILEDVFFERFVMQ
jgi:flagellar FliL protein